MATRVAAEQSSLLGDTAGYAVRFDSKYTSRTAIKYCTDGVLLRETLTDPLLEKYSVVLVDEAHERSLHTDILLGLLKKILRKRKDLKVVVMSATLDAQLFKDFFETSHKGSSPSACIISIAGRLFPVDYQYLESPANNYVQKVIIILPYNSTKCSYFISLSLSLFLGSRDCAVDTCS